MSDFTLKRKFPITANPQGTSTDSLTKIGIGNDIYDVGKGGGESGGIDGSTVTPTDNVQTWLACAGLHQSYTTLNEVLADSAVLSALMSSTNAVDYLVRSTTWASTICANETAMNCIGMNDYCADILKSNSIWLNAICDSAYFKEVLNVHVPKMTSNTTPYGIASASSITSTSYDAWHAFDGATNTWITDNYSNGAWIQYEFVNPVCVNKFVFADRAENNYHRVVEAHLKASNDGTNFVNLLDFNTPSNNTILTYSVENNTKYLYYRVVLDSYNDDMSSIGGSKACVARLIQFYGRGKNFVVDNKADISSIGIDENNTTASKDYVAGEFFYKNGKLGEVLTSISKGAAFTLNTNYKETDVAEVIKNISTLQNDLFTVKMIGTTESLFKYINSVTLSGLRTIYRYDWATVTTFDGKYLLGWGSPYAAFVDGTNTGIITIKFNQRIALSNVFITTWSRANSITISGSNDGNTYTTLFNGSDGGSHDLIAKLNPVGYYSYYKITMPGQNKGPAIYGILLY